MKNKTVITHRLAEKAKGFVKSGSEIYHGNLPETAKNHQ